MARFITSANSEFTLTIPGVFSGPVVLQGYAVDDAFDTANVKPAEAKKGVDGRKSSGFTPYLVVMKIHLMPDSPAIDIFDQWLGALNAARDDLPATEGSIWAPSLGKAWACANGTLTESSAVPNAKKLFEAQEYEITWDTVDVSNV
jgi:hypothetical protein